MLTSRRVGELLGDLQRALGQVDRGHVEPALRELDAVDADAATDLEEAAGAALQLREQVDEVVVGRVAPRFDLTEVLVRRAARVGVVLVVDVRLPEVLDRLDRGVGLGPHALPTFPLRTPIVPKGPKSTVPPSELTNRSCQSSKPIICHNMK